MNRLHASPLPPARHLQGIVRAYRLGMDAQADEALVRFLELLHESLASSEEEDVLHPVPGAQLNALLEALHAAQTRNDTLRVADLLQHKLRPLLYPA